MDAFGVNEGVVIMKIIIVGNGKLSKSLTKGLAIRYSIAKWDDYDKSLNAKNIVIHTGSGRQLNECVGYCNRTNSILLELSTGTSINNYDIQCPVIVCPNTAIPILKLMYIINKYGKMFRKYKIKITESHQKNKNTIAGTAVDIARSLEVPITEIKSLRDIDVQKNLIGIPDQHLDLHAYHQIIIEDEGCEIKLETKVLGHLAYVSGIKEIIEIVKEKELHSKIYPIIDILKN